MEPLDYFIQKDQKKLRCGYTTGSCAAAAAKAAADMLLSGKPVSAVSLQTPQGIDLHLSVQDCSLEPDAVSCAVQKDSGDDPDVTDGVLVYARVSRRSEPGIVIDGGPGVGRVTKPGLEQPVGAAAINRIPRQMIAQAVASVWEEAEEPGGLQVEISIPDGVELAKKTFNPRLGIVGGLSILGTTGIVEPMSDRALVETIRAELHVQAAAGTDYLLLTPGNYGETFAREQLGLRNVPAVQCSNFIGDALDLAGSLPFRGILLIGHIGKLVKLAGGMWNTHSRYGDCRMEILTAHTALTGQASPACIQQVMSSNTTDEALDILEQAGLRDAVIASLLRAIDRHLHHRAPEPLPVGVLLFSNRHGWLGQNQTADQLIPYFQTGFPRKET